MKKTQKLLALLCALVVLIGVYYGVVNYVKSSEEAALAETELLLDETASDIAGVAFTTQEGEKAAFTMSDDTWSLTSDTSFDVDESVLDSMVTDLTGIEVLETLTEIEDLSEYGLDDPINVITITKTDGSTIKIALGNENATTSMYYVYLNDDTDTVYCISTDLISTFDMSLESMRYVEEETEDAAEDTTTEDTTTEDEV